MLVTRRRAPCPPLAGASELAATTAESPANCAGLQQQHRRTHAAHTRRRRPTSRCPSREFIRPAAGRAGPMPLRARTQRERVNSPQRQRKAPQTARGFSSNTAACLRHTPVGEGRHRVVPAANSFARRPGALSPCPSARGPRAGASELAATTAESPANCAGLQQQHRRTQAAHTRRRRPTSRCPSREFIRPAAGRAGPMPLRARTQRERVNSPQQRREAPQTARGFNSNTAAHMRHIPVRAGGHRVFPAREFIRPAAGRAESMPRARPAATAPRSLRGFPLFQPRVHPPETDLAGEIADRGAAVHPHIRPKPKCSGGV
jgi:hypothetical protein